MKKLLSLLLCLCMVLSFMVPAAVGAGRYAVNNTQSATGATILQQARKWANRGATYWSGTSPWEKSVAWRTGYTVDGQTSFDCSGFVGRVLNDAGFRGASYAPSYGTTVLSQNYGKYSIGISIEELVNYGKDLSAAVSKAKNGDYSGLQAGDIIGWTSGSLGRHVIIYAGLNSSGRPTMIEFTGSGYLERVISSSYQNAFQYGARFTDNAGPDGGGTALTLSNANYPSSINEGNVFSVTGEISSGSQLTSVTVAVYDMSGNYMTGVQNVNPKSNYYNIKSSADSVVYFNHLSAGTYRYVVSARNAAGTSKEFINKTFQVIGKTVYYTVTFDANGGTVDPKTRTIAGDSKIGALPTPTRAGYTFNGWKHSNGSLISSDYIVTANVTFYASWTAKTYSVTFDPNGGTGEVSNYVRSYGSPVAYLPETSREGYFFIGWMCNGKYISTSTIVEGDMQVKAQWELSTVAYPVEGGNIFFDCATGKITSSEKTITKAVIPAYINGYQVVGIKAGAFSGCKQLTEVSIPPSVKEIEATSFLNGGAFACCDNLKTVRLAYGLEKIGDASFWNCPSLQVITIPDSVTYIGGSAFVDCKNLEEFIYPDGVESFNMGSFQGCTNLKRIHLGASLKGFSSYWLSGCVNLEEVSVSSQNENYVEVDGVLYNKAMTSIVFFPRTRLGSFSIPEGIKGVSQGAFWYCKLTNIVIPASYTGGFRSIDLMINGENMQSIEVAEGNEKYCSVDGIVFSKDGSTLVQYPQGRSGPYTIPNSVTTLAKYSFYGCGGLTSVIIPDSVTSIEDDVYGSNTFTGCINLTSVRLSQNLPVIGGSMFSGCTSLESIDIPSSVTTIKYYAFRNCSSLRTIKIPDSVTEIGYSVFESCSSLQNVELSKNITNIPSSSFLNCYELKSVVIPDGVMLAVQDHISIRITFQQFK